jgi:hypothetical protein
LEQLNDLHRPFADEILKVSSIGISGPFKKMLRSPVMGQRLFAMLDYQWHGAASCCVISVVFHVTKHRA